MEEKVFHCTNCGAKLSAGEDEIGEEFECPVCDSMQTVPGESKPPKATKKDGPPSVTIPGSAVNPPSSKVVRIPKKKIVISSKDDEDDLEDLEEMIEEEIDEEIGGSGLRVAAMALGTAGMLFCVMAFLWALVGNRDGELNWWVMIMTFVGTFILALMGLVMAQIAFRVERISAYVRRILPED